MSEAMEKSVPAKSRPKAGKARGRYYWHKWAAAILLGLYLTYHFWPHDEWIEEVVLDSGERVWIYRQAIAERTCPFGGTCEWIGKEHRIAVLAEKSHDRQARGAVLTMPFRPLYLGKNPASGNWWVASIVEDCWVAVQRKSPNLYHLHELAQDGWHEVPMPDSFRQKQPNLLRGFGYVLSERVNEVSDEQKWKWQRRRVAPESVGGRFLLDKQNDCIKDIDISVLKKMGLK